MSLRERLGVSEDFLGACCVTLCVGVAMASAASAITWPLCWSHVRRTESMIQGGYEEQPNPADRNGGVLLRKAGGKEGGTR